MIEENPYASNTAPRRTLIVEDGTTYHVEFHGDLTSVEVISPIGLRARGNALLNKDDVYNKQFGEALATARATSRLLHKYARWLAKEGFRTGDIR